jgi:sugar lactone lactonase YvrE
MKFFACRKSVFALFALLGFTVASYPANLVISSFDASGNIGWSNAFPSGVCTDEIRTNLTAAPWVTRQNFFTTSSVGNASTPAPPGNQFHRLLSVDISTNTPQGYTNLLNSYGTLTTIAGNGFGGVDGSNYWQSSFEGGYATNAALSRPHFAMADNSGNVFIVDKDSHSVLKVTPDGHIHTVAGTHVAGNNGDGPGAGTNLQLNFPNGLWVRGDGTVYILDTGNNRVCRLDTNGVMTKLFTVSSGITTGRGLWVKDDESVVYFCSKTDLRKRIPGNITTINPSFNDLANIAVNASGDIIATDRGYNKVYFVSALTSTISTLFGDGSTNAVVDGTLALTNGLYGVRGVWLFPTGGYLLALHEGNDVLYVDPAGVLHVLVDGQKNSHNGDGQWFYASGPPKISESRAVSMDNQGNILITENDTGYVRKIEFRRLQP